MRCVLQMTQSWRPSAWADAWYGYYAGKRYYELSEMSMLKKFWVSPLLVSAAKLAIFYTAQAKQALGHQLFWATSAGGAVLILRYMYGRALRFLNRNLIPGSHTYQRGTVKNLPLLLEHLRELQAADHVLQTHLKTLRSQSADTGREQGTSSLAVMHCLQSHAYVTSNLTSRLADACEKYTGRRLTDLDEAEEAMEAAYQAGAYVYFTT